MANPKLPSELPQSLLFLDTDLLVKQRSAVTFVENTTFGALKSKIKAESQVEILAIGDTRYAPTSANIIENGDNISLLTNDSQFVSIGSNISQFNNDSNYLLSGSAISLLDNDVGYALTTDPISTFTNDSGYLTSAIQPGNDISLLFNDVGYIAPGDNLSDLINDVGFVDASTPVSTFPNDAAYISVGAPISLLANNANYLIPGNSIGLLTNDGTYLQDNADISRLNNNLDFVPVGADISLFNNDRLYLIDDVAKLDNFNDVVLVLPAEDDVLRFVGGKWVNSSLSFLGVTSFNGRLGAVISLVGDYSAFYEPVFSKNTAFNKDFGTTAGTVLEGDTVIGDLLAANNLSDLADIPTARANLNVDVAGTDNSTNVSLGGVANDTTDDTLDLAGQVLTVNLVTTSSDGAMSGDDKQKLDSLVLNSDFWATGLEVTEHSPLNQTVDFASGTYFIDGVSKTITPGGVYDLENGFGSIDHYFGFTGNQHALVMIYVDVAEVIKSVAGTTVESNEIAPVPILPVDSVCIAIVHIKVNGSSIPRDIKNEDITDCRFQISVSTDEFVKVSPDDTTTGHLNDKITSNGNVTFTIENPSGNETLKADVDIASDSAVAANTAKVTNATHTGEVTGSTTLTVDKTTITNKTLVTASTSDTLLISDASDSDNLKKALVSDFIGSSVSRLTTVFTKNGNTTNGTFLSIGEVQTSTTQGWVVPLNATIEVVTINRTDSDNADIEILVDGTVGVTVNTAATTVVDSSMSFSVTAGEVISVRNKSGSNTISDPIVAVIFEVS